jgi:hypothetical protein
VLVTCRQHSRKASGDVTGMAMRWCGLGCWRPKASFTAVMGYKEIPTLTTAMGRHFNPKMLARKEEVTQSPPKPPPKFHGTRDVLQVTCTAR